MPYVQQRRGTASALAAANEIPLAGQIFFETDTGKIKVGNGTTAYASLEYITDASNLIDASIPASKLAANSVTTAKIADDAVTNAKVADNAITEAQIAAASVSVTKIGDQAVHASKIKDGAVSQAKMAGNSIGTLQIIDGSVNAAKITANAVGTSEIQAGAVDTAELAGSAVTEAKLSDDAVTYAKIQNVGAGKVLGNEQGAAGSVEEIDSTSFGRGLLNVADGATLATAIGAATTSDITTAINNLIDSAPGALDTLNELAAAINDDNAFSTTVTNSIATKLPLAGGTVTGDIDMQREQTGSPLTTTSPTKIDWGNSNGGAFSNAATDLDYIRLYTSGSTYAGMGITSGNFNIGSTGGINLTVYAGGFHHATFKSNGLTEFERPVEFKSNINAATRIEVPRADSPGTPKIVSEYNGSVDTDTGIYFPAADNVAFSVNGKRKIDVTENVILVDRKGGNPSLKASATGVDGSAGGWMIIDSVTNPCSLNYYSGADVQLAYGGGGATVGTVAQGTYKFRVHGGQSHFSNAITVAADAVYAPVYRSSIDGTVGAAAYGRENDGNTGMFFPAADKVALTAGGTEMFRAESGAIEVTQQFRIPDGTNVSPGLAFSSDTDTGIKLNSNGNMDLQHGGSNKISVTSAGSSLGGTVTFSGNVSDGTTTKTAAELLAPSAYGANLLFG